MYLGFNLGTDEDLVVVRHDFDFVPAPAVTLLLSWWMDSLSYDPL